MKRKKISKAISIMLALVMVITMMPQMAFAAGETTVGTATVTMLNESNEEACEYNAIFDAKAEITASKDSAKLKILAANPLPNFKDQKQDTFGDFTIIEGAGTYNVAAVSNNAPGQMMSARESNGVYGLEQNKQYSAVSFTFNLANEDISEGKIFKIKTKLGFGEKENQEVIFRLKLTNVDIKVPTGPDMQELKKQIEDKLAEIDAMNPEDYPADKWDVLQKNVKYVKENINDPSKVEAEGEMWLSLLQRGIDGLGPAIKPEKPGTEIKLEDGVYSVPVQGFSDFKRNKEESRPQRKMLYSNALINVKNGKAELTIRLCGYDSYVKSFVVDQKYMKEIEENYNPKKRPYYHAVRRDRFDFEHTNLSPQARKSWIGYDVTTSPEAKDYYLPDNSIKTKDYPNMGYTDVTIPITDLTLDAAIYMFQKEEFKNSYPEFLVIDIDNARVEKLDKLPQNGKLPLSVIIEDGSYSTSSTGTADDKSTNTIKSMFGNAEATIQDGTAKVNIPVINDKVDYVGEMSKRTKDTFIYINNLDRKTIEKEDYSSIFSNGCASITLDFKSYEDFVFGKRIRITTNDLPEVERPFGYYGGIRFSIDKAENVELVDPVTGIKFDTDSFNVDKNSKLNVKKIDESNPAYNIIDGFYSAYKNYEAYDINVTNNNENVNIDKSGIISIPVPKGWSEKHIIIDRMKADGHFEDGPKFEIKNGYITFKTSNMGKWILAEKQNYEVSTKLANGTYDVNVAAWNMTLDQPSMADKAISKKAKLVVKDGVRTLYLNLKATSQQGLSSYMSNMWIYEKGTVVQENGYPDPNAKLYDAVPYKYYRGEGGKHLVDVYNKNTLNFYPENIDFELPTDKYEFPVKFRVPVMDSIGEGDMSREARFRIDYESAVKISEETTLPPINDAIKEELEIVNMLKKADYTPGSWKVLIDAKEKLVAEQSTATFEQLQADYYAMRTARYALVESKLNYATLENKINEAKGYSASQYTEDSFNALQSAITAAESVLNNNTNTQESIDKAVSSLNTAIGNLVPVKGPDVSTGLADGDYLIETTMLHETKDQKSMCDLMFDKYAKATVLGENATVKLYVANPVPGFPDQGADGTVKNFVINYNGQEYPAADGGLGTGAKMTAKDTNSTFGFEAGKQYAAQVLTITLPKKALNEQTLTVNTYVNVVMNTNVVFRIKLDSIRSGSDVPSGGGEVTPDPEKPAVPRAVQNVKVKTDNGLLKVTFDKVTNADSYRVYVKQVGVKGGFRWFHGNSEGTIIKQLYKKALVKNGKYQIKVTAINKAGEGVASKVKTVFANRIGTKSAKMFAPKFVSIKGNKVVAKKVYVKNTPKKLQYKVSYKLKGTKAWKSAGYSAKNVKYIKGLKKGRVYNFALRYRYVSAVNGKTFVYSKIAYKTVRVR